MARYINCPNCGYVGKTKWSFDGTAKARALWILGFIILIIGSISINSWFYGFCLLIVALAYSIWKEDTKYSACLKCNNDRGMRLTIKEFRQYEKTGELPLSKNLKKCPYCAETIRIEANVCKHCGREIELATAT